MEIYNNEKSFLKKNLRSKRISANANPMEFSFDVPPGEYAIAVYQDINNNNKLDAGLFHIPKEPYGFSNHYRPSFSAPRYSDCSIQIQESTSVFIELK